MVTVLGQVPTAGDDVGVAAHVLDYLYDALTGGEGELLLAHQERAGDLDKGELAAYEVGQPDVEAGVHQDVGRHGIAARSTGRRVPEQQLVTLNVEVGPKDGLAPDHELAHLVLLIYDLQGRRSPTQPVSVPYRSGHAGC